VKNKRLDNTSRKNIIGKVIKKIIISYQNLIFNHCYRIENWELITENLATMEEDFLKNAMSQADDFDDDATPDDDEEEKEKEEGDSEEEEEVDANEIEEEEDDTTEPEEE